MPTDEYPDLVTTSDRRSDGEVSENVLYLDHEGTKFVPVGPAGLPSISSRDLP